MKCPVCGQVNDDLLCPKCGFDSSRDYGKYPTFGPVGKAASVSALRKQRQEKQKPEKRIAPENTAKPVAPPKSAPPAKPHPQTTTSTPVNHSAVSTVSPSTASPVSKNKWIALLLCFFLGMFGAHKFYEGNKKMGILYLCTYGLFGYGWLFDCIMLLFKPNPYIPRFRLKS